MLKFNDLKELILMVESEMGDDVIASILKIKPKKIKGLYKKAKKLTTKDVDEAEAAGGGSPGTAAPAGPSNNHKWAGAQHGRANPIDQNHKWESGVNRGSDNQLS
jgi:ribosomal protein L12E/L44/L45/RPP1/RPP2